VCSSSMKPEASSGELGLVASAESQLTLGLPAQGDGFLDDPAVGKPLLHPHHFIVRVAPKTLPDTWAQAGHVANRQQKNTACVMHVCTNR
jgi:hypothetical protein